MKFYGFRLNSQVLEIAKQFYRHELRRNILFGFLLSFLKDV